MPPICVGLFYRTPPKNWFICQLSVSTVALPSAFPVFLHDQFNIFQSFHIDLKKVYISTPGFNIASGSQSMSCFCLINQQRFKKECTTIETTHRHHSSLVSDFLTRPPECSGRVHWESCSDSWHFRGTVNTLRLHMWTLSTLQSQLWPYRFSSALLHTSGLLLTLKTSFTTRPCVPVRAPNTPLYAGLPRQQSAAHQHSTTVPLKSGEGLYFVFLIFRGWFFCNFSLIALVYF